MAILSNDPGMLFIDDCTTAIVADSELWYNAVRFRKAIEQTPQPVPT
jgi:hypothetical protein